MTPGTKLGPYEIVSRLGEGGMGEVFRATDTRLNRTVAIKVLKEQFTERFQKEARSVATLNHPNICALFDVGPNYLVLEYLEGKPLTTPQPLKQLLKIGAEVASALEAAHRKGIVHCDLKPGNILITANGAKVLDFGLARSAKREPGPNDATLTAGSIGIGTIEGTLPYMAPEQLEARDIDRRTDIFALGAVLYEMAPARGRFQASRKRRSSPAFFTPSPSSPPNASPEFRNTSTVSSAAASPRIPKNAGNPRKTSLLN